MAETWLFSYFTSGTRPCLQYKYFKKNYPDIKLVGNSKNFYLLPQFFDIQNLDSKKIEVKEGEILDLGNHKLKFIMAPMVHWPRGNDDIWRKRKNKK